MGVPSIKPGSWEVRVSDKRRNNSTAGGPSSLTPLTLGAHEPCPPKVDNVDKVDESVEVKNPSTFIPPVPPKKTEKAAQVGLATLASLARDT
jgi:hypothetical protein